MTMLQWDGAGKEGTSEREGGGGPRWYRSSSAGCYSIQQDLMGESVRVCVCVSQVLAWSVPWVLCWDILHIRYNDRDGPG